MPTSDEYPALQQQYADALNARLNPEVPKPKPAPVEEEVKSAEEDKPADTAAPAEESNQTEEVAKESSEEAMETEETEKPEAEANEAENDEEKEKEDGDEAQEDENEEETNGKTPTPWRELDVKSMKVNELREELEARGLNAKGLKSQLATRLTKDIKAEQEREEQEGKSESKGDSDEATKDGDKPQEAKEEEGGKEKSSEEVVEVKDEPEVMEVEVDGSKKKDEEIFVKPKPIDERTKRELTNGYKLPESPHILVHPNTKAKSGKFDCSTTSLSVLLDYRTDDNKEGTFEVSLFAELFNEMLMRDAGFKLYKAIVDVPEKAKEDKKEDKKPADKKDEAAKEDEAAAPEEKKEEAEDKEKEKEKEKEKKKKLVTADKDLLLACSYFDLGHCGYFETKDLEDILFMMNLSLSRAQIKKLVAKVTTSKDQVSYRVLTDKPEDVAEELKAKVADESEAERLDELGRGFKAFLPSISVAKDGESEQGAPVESGDGVCTFRGELIKKK